MPLHLGVASEGTKVAIQAIGASNSAIFKQWYYATDTEEFFYGKSTGALAGPIPSGGDFNSFNITDGTNTETVGDGEDLLFEGINLIKAVIGATNKVTYQIDPAGSSEGNVVVISGGVPTWGDGNDFIESLTDTNSIGLTVSSRSISANLKIATDSDNSATVNGTGLYVKDISIASGSSNYLSYNSTTKEISVQPLGIIDVVVASEADLTAFIAANYTVGNEYQEGDMVLVPNDSKSYVHNGGVAGTSADFTQIQNPNLTDAYIRSLLVEGNGVEYNSSTGDISLRIGGTNNDLSFSGTNLFVDVSESDVTDTSGLVVAANNVTSLQSLLDSIAGSVASSGFSVSGNNGTNFDIVSGNTFNIIGGTVLKTTLSSPDTLTVDFDTSGVSNDAVPTFNGSTVSWVVPSFNSWLFTNGLTKSGDNIELGGTLTKTTTLNLSTFRLDMIGTGNLTVGGTNGTSKLTVKSGDIEVDQSGSGLILKSANGNRWRLNIDNNGFLNTTSL